MLCEMMKGPTIDRIEGGLVAAAGVLSFITKGEIQTLV